MKSQIIFSLSKIDTNIQYSTTEKSKYMKDEIEILTSGLLSFEKYNLKAVLKIDIFRAYICIIGIYK